MSNLERIISLGNKYDNLTRIRAGFKSRNQTAWFMIWKEYWSDGDVVFARIKYSIG